MKYFIPFLFILSSILLNAQISYINMDANSKWNQNYSGTTRIKVSWENPSSSNYKERQWVEEAIAETWEKYSNLDLYGWEAANYNTTGIRILIDDYAHPHTKGLGTQLNGKRNGMVLNFNFLGNFKCNRSREDCIKFIAVHEFGHALGIAHEHNRTDCLCNEEPQGSGGGYYVTPCDINSVMNYCNPKWSNHGELSYYDIKGIQTIYGEADNKPDTYEKPKYKKGGLSIVNELGETQIWENLYLEIGSAQFLFNINENNNKEIKRATLGSSGYFNYTVYSKTRRRNGSIYTGYGSGKIYLDKNDNYKLELFLDAKGYGQNQYGIYLEATKL